MIRHYAFSHGKLFELTEVTPAHFKEGGRRTEQGNKFERMEETAKNGKDANSDEEVESGEKSQENVVEQEILEMAFSGARIKSSDIKPSNVKSGSKCQENRRGTGGDRVCGSISDGRRQKKKRKLFSEAGIGPQILE